MLIMPSLKKGFIVEQFLWNYLNCKKYKLSNIGEEGEGEREEGIQNLTTLCRISMLFYKELQICLYLG